MLENMLHVGVVVHFFLVIFISSFRAKVLECSAKEDNNVTELFKTMLSLSRFLPVGSSNEGTSGLKRRSSAYVSASSSRSEYHNHLHVSY